MSAARRVKRWLREHNRLGDVYARLASKWLTLRVAAYQRVVGRYHSAARFDRLFRAQRDPWNYYSDSIALHRRELLAAALPENSARVLEIGCAEGFVTRLLASRSADLIAVDISTVALERARDACGSLRNVRFEVFDLQNDALPGRFDAIICAGVLVFLPPKVQIRTCNAIIAALAEGGTLVLEHTQQAYPGECAGSEIHALYASQPSLSTVSHAVVGNYAITVLKKGAS